VVGDAEVDDRLERAFAFFCCTDELVLPKNSQSWVQKDINRTTKYVMRAALVNAYARLCRTKLNNPWSTHKITRGRKTATVTRLLNVDQILTASTPSIIKGELVWRKNTPNIKTKYSFIAPDFEPTYEYT